MKDLSGKVAFITGGGSGVGLGQAEVFGAAGCRVVIADIRDDHLGHAARHLRERGVDAHPVHLDVMDRNAFAAVADDVERTVGPVDLLFNTAGVSIFGPLARATYADYDWQMGVNFGGVVNGVQTFVPRMIRRARGGHVVNTASMSALLASAPAGIYSASKFAVRGLSEALRLELADRGIGVTIVCPGTVNTNIAESYRTRPDDYAGTGHVIDDEFVALLAQFYSSGMDPVELGRHVLAAVVADEPYVIPYPEMRAPLAAHFEAILSALPPEGSDPDGVARRGEAMAAYQAERKRLFRKYYGG